MKTYIQNVARKFKNLFKPKEDAKTIASMLLKKHKQKNVPVDVFRIACNEGWPVYIFDSTNFDNPIVLGGFVDITGKRIFVDGKYDIYSQRLLAAEALGSVFMKHINNEDEYKKFTLEPYANPAIAYKFTDEMREFAYNLLMPKKYVRHTVFATGFTWDEIAKSYFSVPTNSYVNRFAYVMGYKK